MPGEPREVHNVETMEDVYNLECVNRASDYPKFCKWAISEERVSPSLMALCDPDPKTGLPLKWYVCGTLAGFAANETGLEVYTKLVGRHPKYDRIPEKVDLPRGPIYIATFGDEIREYPADLINDLSWQFGVNILDGADSVKLKEG